MVPTTTIIVANIYTALIRAVPGCSADFIAAVLNREGFAPARHLAMSGDISVCHHWGVEARDAVQHPQSTGQLPQQNGTLSRWTNLPHIYPLIQSLQQPQGTSIISIRQINKDNFHCTIIHNVETRSKLKTKTGKSLNKWWYNYLTEKNGKCL